MTTQHHPVASRPVPRLVSAKTDLESLEGVSQRAPELADKLSELRDPLRRLEARRYLPRHDDLDALGQIAVRELLTCVWRKGQGYT